MKQLFPFQKASYDACVDFLNNKDPKDNSGIIVAPTGYGKSVLIAKLSQEFDRPLLFVVPSIELLKQNKAAIELEGGVVSVYSGSFGQKVVSGLTIATVDSLKDVSEFKKFKVRDVIVDEADYKYSEKGQFMEFYKALKPKRLLGLTATPFKMSSNKGFMCLTFLDKLRPKLFKRIVHVTQIQEVIGAGRWSDVEYDVREFDSSQLKVNTSGTDFDEASIKKELERQGVKRQVCVDLLETLRTKKKWEKVLVFTDSVETAEIMSSWINGKGYARSEVVSAFTGKGDRKNFIDEFKDENSNLDVLINYGTLSTGFDCSLVSHVFVARPIGVLRTWVQVVGRGVRVDDKKSSCRVTDYCGNHGRFGAVSELVFEYVENYGWAVFGSGGRLLTGVPLGLGKTITKEWLKNPPKPVFIKSDLKFPWGKYQGKLVKFCPLHYRSFVLDKMDLDITIERNRELKALLEQLREQEYLRLFQL